MDRVQVLVQIKGGLHFRQVRETSKMTVTMAQTVLKSTRSGQGVRKERCREQCAVREMRE